ncbi:MAG: type II secretion system F family protein [Nanoarchaeota archaeon]
MKNEQFTFESIGKAFVPKRFRHILLNYVMKAGLEDVPWKPFGVAFYGIFFATLILYLNPLFPVYSYFVQFTLFAVFVYTFLFWGGTMLVLSGLFMVAFKTVFDLRIFQRRMMIEEVFPDFLQLTAANIRSGMPIDRALWYAVRPRFGVLAKEVELVAKETLSGRDLEKSLVEFSKKYDSPTVERAINLLISGLEAGGEIGDLLTKIAMDIQETRIMKKDMAANVMTYVIFISFATLLAAPFLFALSYNLLIVIQRIMGNISLPQDSMSGGGFGNLLINMSAESISIPDFKIFAVLMLAVTSFFSAVIIAIIQKGSVKEGFKYIPIFIVSTIAIFYIASAILGLFLGSIV